jgi:lipopolysaccharide biosynthesis glycosyltransferase
LNFIITAINEKYWNPWGISWIASLRELAQTKYTPIIIDFGLKTSTANKIKEFGITIYQGKKKSTIRNDALATIAQLNKQVCGNFVYFDADVWFQDNIDQLFDQIDNRIIMSQNKNAGFVAGSKKSWQKYDIINSITNFTKDGEKIDCLMKHFDSDINFVNNIYNFINLPNLKDEKGTLNFQGEMPLAIHPTGSLKKLATNRNILFHERYPDIFSEYSLKRKNLPHILLNKSSNILDEPECS